MTTSTWNETEIRAQFNECETLGQIIERIEMTFSERGEVICEIRVNGVLLSEEDETKFASSAVSGIRDLAIASNRPEDLIFSAINSARTLLPELETSCHTAAENFRGNDLGRAQKSFHECLEGCQWFVDTLLHARGAASGIDQPIAQPERWFEAEKVVGRAVREMSEAYSKEDFVLVADLLEYELSGSFDIWKDILRVEVSTRSPSAEA